MATGLAGLKIRDTNGFAWWCPRNKGHLRCLSMMGGGYALRVHQTWLIGRSLRMYYVQHCHVFGWKEDRACHVLKSIWRMTDMHQFSKVDTVPISNQRLYNTKDPFFFIIDSHNTTKRTIIKATVILLNRERETNNIHLKPFPSVHRRPESYYAHLEVGAEFDHP